MEVQRTEFLQFYEQDEQNFQDAKNSLVLNPVPFCNPVRAPAFKPAVHFFEMNSSEQSFSGFMDRMNRICRMPKTVSVLNLILSNLVILSKPQLLESVVHFFEMKLQRTDLLRFYGQDEQDLQDAKNSFCS